MTRQQFKSIVKECLVEILAEGMGSSIGDSINEAAAKKIKKQLPEKHQSFSDVLQQNASRTKIRPLPSNISAVKDAILKEAGNNAVMVDILSDTALNTLPTMLESDRAKSHLQPTGTVERVVAAATPDQLFGEEAASKWAALAFMDPTKK